MSEWLILERLENNDLPLPSYATKHSAGMDFAACLTRLSYVITDDGVRFPVAPTPQLSFESHQTRMIPLGYRCEFGQQCVLTLHVRSSIGLQGLMLANGTGIVDPDYRGELFACIFNRTNKPQIIRHGQRIVQGVLIEFERPVISERHVTDTERGENGFGSTGG